MSLFSNMTLETTEFLVIGAGLPRTGTSSLKIALETLLDGKCYHMTRFFESIGSGENHSSFWTKALNSDVREEVSSIIRDVSDPFITSLVAMSSGVAKVLSRQRLLCQCRLSSLSVLQGHDEGLSQGQGHPLGKRSGDLVPVCAGHHLQVTDGKKVVADSDLLVAD